MFKEISEKLKKVMENPTLPSVLGLMMVVAGVSLFFYVGIYLCLIHGIINVLDYVRGEEISPAWLIVTGDASWGSLSWRIVDML